MTYILFWPTFASSSEEVFYSLKIDNKFMRQLKITKSITNRESASLDKYLQEIGREDLITAEIEVELAQRIKAGDELYWLKIYKDNEDKLLSQ